MNDELLPDLPDGVAGALGVLRHALADPLSAAGLKLELLERRLASICPGDASLVDRVRGVKSDLGVAGRLIDLLPLLARIAGETPSGTSIEELCRTAGTPVDEGGEPLPRLVLRRVATLDALRSLVRLFGPPGPGAASPRVVTEGTPDRVGLRIEIPRPFGDVDPERLFRLPRGAEGAEELFLARAGVETDGGRLELVDRGGQPAAFLSWPRPARPAEEGATP